MELMLIISSPLIWAVFTFYSSYLFWVNWSRPPLPPGPPTLPLIGNLHQISKGDEVQTVLQKWYGQLGHVICLRLGLRKVIYLGNYQAAHDLLEKKGEIYSARPRMIMANECVTKGYHTAILPYGSKWRSHRRLHMSVLGVRSAYQWRPVQNLESLQLIHNLLFTNAFIPAFERFATSTLTALVFGKRMINGEESEYQRIGEISNATQRVFGTAFWLVDYFPILNNLPRCFAPWKRIGDKVFTETIEFYRQCTAQSESAGSWNWTQHLLKQPEAKKLTPDEVSYILGNFYANGGDSIASTLRVCVLAAILHPKIVSKAQAELDTVTCADRLPGFDDLQHLPYTEAFVKEAMRWRPIAPDGQPHSVTEDDLYQGYWIPRGSTIVANIWAICMDQEIFDDPATFQPERWIHNPDMPEIGFGFGRRVCPGSHFAKDSLFIAVSRLLWTFNLKHATRDGRIVELNPWDLETDGPACRARPFPAILEVRDMRHREAVEQAWLHAEKDVQRILSKISDSRHNK
ncbi:hypothetical protein RU639_006960 [Aspergillus parasiticus]